MSIILIFYREILFTIPEELRHFFFYDRELLPKLASSVNKTLEYQFHNIYKKNKRKIKVAKSSPDYFTNSDIVHYGLITVIHTFFFNDLANNKKKKYVTMDIDKFVQQILIHLPPKNF